MSSKTASPIEQKKEEKDSNGSSSPDWGAFGMSVFQGLIFTIAWGILGANFVFLVSQDVTRLFPSNPKAPPYSDRKKGLVDLKYAKEKALAVKAKAAEVKEIAQEKAAKLKKAAMVGGGGIPACMAKNLGSLSFSGDAVEKLDRLTGAS